MAPALGELQDTHQPPKDKPGEAVHLDHRSTLDTGARLVSVPRQSRGKNHQECTAGEGGQQGEQRCFHPRFTGERKRLKRRVNGKFSPRVSPRVGAAAVSCGHFPELCWLHPVSLPVSGRYRRGPASPSRPPANISSPGGLALVTLPEWPPSPSGGVPGPTASSGAPHLHQNSFFYDFLPGGRFLPLDSANRGQDTQLTGWFSAASQPQCRCMAGNTVLVTPGVTNTPDPQHGPTASVRKVRFLGPALPIHGRVSTAALALRWQC